MVVKLEGTPGNSGLKVGDKNVVAVKYLSDRMMSYAQVDEFVRRTVSEWHSKGLKGSVYANVQMPTGDWRMSSKQKISHGTHIFAVDHYDEEALRRYTQRYKYQRFQIYFVPDGGQGGNDKHNDCLYQCICQFYGMDEKRIAKQVNKPWRLKSFLKIDRDAKVRIEQLQELADYMKVNFEVEGDETYRTIGEHKQTITLSLLNEHFTLPYHEKLKVFNLKKKSKYLAYRKVSNHNFEIHIGGTLVNDTDIKDYEKEYCCIEVTEQPTQADIDNFIEAQKEIFQVSKGVIDISRCGTNYTGMVRLLFNQLEREQIEPEEISQQECEFLSIHGAIMYTRSAFGEVPGDEELAYEGFARLLDVNGQYPSVMANARNSFPISKPTYKKVTKDTMKIAGEKGKAYFPYGIYKAVVSKSNNDNDLRFRFNADNTYTHIDLTRAEKLGLKIDPVDADINVALYDQTSRRNGADLFANYINYLVKLIAECKLKASKKSLKIIRNALWGYLGKRKTLIVTRKNDDDEFELLSNFVMTSYDPDEHKCIHGYISNKLYLTPFGRVCPFVTSYAREQINQIIDKCPEKIVRVHTDSILVIDPEAKFQTSEKLGGLKLEREGQCKVYKKIGQKIEWI